MIFDHVLRALVSSRAKTGVRAATCAALCLLSEGHRATAPGVAGLLGIATSTAQKHLNEAVERGYLEKTTAGMVSGRSTGARVRYVLPRTGR